MKSPTKMTDDELKESWKQGCNWLDKNLYDEKLWLAGLNRLEKIEEELQRRNVKYAQE